MDKATLDWIAGVGSVLDIFPSAGKANKPKFDWDNLISETEQESAWADVNNAINSQIVRLYYKLREEDASNKAAMSRLDNIAGEIESLCGIDVGDAAYDMCPDITSRQSKDARNDPFSVRGT